MDLFILKLMTERSLSAKNKAEIVAPGWKNELEKNIEWVKI